MGLPAAVAACPREPAQPPMEVPVASPTPPPKTASAPPADAPDATAAAPAHPRAEGIDATAPKRPPGPNVPSWDVAFPYPAGDRRTQWGCQQHARCFALDELARAVGGAAVPTTIEGCPPSVQVACGCAPGAACDDPGAACTAPRSEAVSAKEGGRRGRAVCCYQIPDHCAPPWVGRVLRGEDGALAVCPPATPRGDWSAFCDDGAPPHAARWERIAAMEHASVASFARASLSLLALGAPPDLVADTHRAALDEIEHARLAYGLAGGGRESMGPAPLVAAVAPLAPANHGSFARATFLDACVGETLGAEAARRESLVARSAAERVVLSRIAEDEARHAELAWRTLAWSVRQGGDEARRALADALAELEAGSYAPADVLHGVVVPCALALLAATPAAA